MKRILVAVALIAALPFASFAQDAAQLRSSLEADRTINELNIDVSAMTDEQVGLAYAVLNDAGKTAETKKKQLMEMFAAEVKQ